MPFKSKAQEKACFATHGFNGKVDCKEWAGVTDQKSLPMKKNKKYQFAGQAQDCGQGMQWDATSLQCIPTPKPMNVDPIFQIPQNYSGDPVTSPKNIVPINSDGSYNKNEYTTNNNILGYNKDFQKLNLGLDLLQGFGNVFSDENTKRNERNNIQKARYSKSAYNPYETGFNQVGIYKTGGGIEINPAHKGLFTKEAKSADMSVAEYASHVLANKDKYSTAVVKRANFAHNFAHQNGGMAHQQDCPNGDCNDQHGLHIQLPQFLQQNQERKDTRISKHYYEDPAKWLLDRSKFDPLTNGYMNPYYPTTSFDPQPNQDGVSYQPNNTAQNGGNIVNNTGYTPGTPTFNNPLNIIPSDSITMKNTPFPVMAHPDNAAPTLMHPGQNYNFKGAKYVTEIPQVPQTQGFQPDSSISNMQYNFKNGNSVTGGYDGGIQVGAKIRFQQGGDVPQVQGQQQGNAELEQGEVFQTQQGNIQKVAENEPTHEDGGSIQPNVNRVLEDTSDKRKDKDSKALRISPAEAQNLIGFKPKGTVSHSKLYEQATKMYDGKLKSFQNKVDANLDYIKQNGGQYAKNSLEQNLNLLQNALTKGQIFDTIYNHQEQVKQMNGIDNNDQQMCGGKPSKKMKWAIGGDPGDDDEPVDPYKGGKTKKGSITPTGLNNAFTFTGGLPAYQQAWQTAGLDLSGYKTNADAQSAVYDYLLKNHPDTIRQMWKQYGNTAAGIKQGLPATLDDNFLNDPNNLQKLKGAYADNLFGARTLVPQAQQQQPPTQQTPFTPKQYNTPNSLHASKFNQPLEWYDTAGNLDNYLSSSERIPVNFEQLNRQPLRAHELNPQPALDANTGDFKAALQTLPNNGVGYANQANLLANKYKVNNEVVGNYANQNNQIADRIDEVNSNNQYQLDSSNLGLRDRAVEQQLKGMEVERQSKLNAFDDYLTKLAQNAQLNRNGNLVLQLTPFFDQTGQFNGNKYIFQDKGDGSADVLDRKSGKLIKTITTDGYGMPKQTKTYVRG